MTLPRVVHSEVLPSGHTLHAIEEAPIDPDAWEEEGRRAPAAAPKVAPFPTVRIASIPEPGATTWLIEKLWTLGAFGIVGALPKAWKTFLTYHVAIAVATGTPLFGRFAAQQGRVLIFSAEGGKKSARRRIGAICRALRVDLDDLQIDVIDVPTLRLDVPAQAARFAATVEAIRPVLVIVDPLREVHGGDENKAEYVAALLAPLRELQARIGCALMLVHHANKPSEGSTKRRPAERLRGSGALAGAVDSALFLEPEGEGETKRVRVSALHRDAVEPDPFVLRLRIQDGADGQAVWLEIVEDEEGEDETDRAINARQKGRAKILRAVKLAAMPGRDPLRSKRAIANAVKVRPATVGALVDELKDEGAITQDDSGAFRPVQKEGQ